MWNPLNSSYRHRSGFRRKRRRRPIARLLPLELLEDRRLLATLTVHQPPRLQLGDAPLVGYSGSSTDQVQVLWQTKPLDAGASEDDTFSVEYRAIGEGSWIAAGAVSTIDLGIEERVNHFVDITGLEFGSGYEYRVQQLRGGQPVTSYEAQFQTRLAPSDASEFTFAAYGDSADGDEISGFRAVQARLNQTLPDFVVTLGDNAYRDGSHPDLDARFDPNVSPEATLWNASRIDYFSFGNHDIETDGGRPLEESIASPVPIEGTNAPASLPASETPEHNYSFDYGLVHFSVIDTNLLRDASRLDGILQWLEADLASSTAKWKIVAGHHPVGGTPDKPESPADNYYKQVVPRMRAAGVDLFMTGHSHAFSWSYPLIGNYLDSATYVEDTDSAYAKNAGLVQVVAGVGGRRTLRRGEYDDFPFIASGYTLDTDVSVEFGYAQVDVTPTQLTVSYVAADDGEIIDSFSISESDQQLVGVEVADAEASEEGTEPAEFRMSRRGSLTGDLAVSYSVSGSATAGVDYEALSGTVIIPDGESYASIPIVPIDDILPEGTEEITIHVIPDPAFELGGAASSETLRLIDNERGTVTFTDLIDTQIHDVYPGEDFSEEDTFTIDAADGGGESIVLMKFEDLFGDGPSQIPAHANLGRAELKLSVFDDGNAISFHRMLREWVETDTWNSLEEGVLPDDVESVAIADAITEFVDKGDLYVDVITSLQYWRDEVDGRNGWLIRGGPRGVDAHSSESRTPPTLSVDFDRPFPGGPGSSSIAGTLWLDSNRDGAINEGEQRLANRLVFLDANQNGVHEFGELFQITGADGYYSFPGLPPDQYTVSARLEPEHSQSFPSGVGFPNGAYVIDLMPNDERSNIDFGAQMATNATHDFGDAPDIYPVTLNDDGARHAGSDLYLGSFIDLEPDGQPSEAADLEGADDDGVTILSSLVVAAGRQTKSSLHVEASESGIVDAWIDFNRDGDWDDAGEQIIAGAAVDAGMNLLSFAVPGTATAGETVTRIRLSSTGGLSPIGAASDGEVEDYLVTTLDGLLLPEVMITAVPGSTAIGFEADEVVIQSDQRDLFRAPASVLQLIGVAGSEADDTYLLNSELHQVLSNDGLRLAGGGGNNRLVIQGGNEISFVGSNISASEMQTLEIQDDDDLVVVVDATSVSRMSPVSDVLHVVTSSGNQLRVEDAEAWRMAAPIVNAEQFLVTAEHQVGSQVITMNTPSPWNNFLQPGDVNNDGSTTASDALRIINELDRRRYSDRETRVMNDPLSLSEWPGLYFDHNADGRASAVDALRVINDMAREALNGSGEQFIANSDSILAGGWEPVILAQRELDRNRDRDRTPSSLLARIETASAFAFSVQADNSQASERRDPSVERSESYQAHAEATDLLLTDYELHLFAREPSIAF